MMINCLNLSIARDANNEIGVDDNRPTLFLLSTKGEVML